ncbi:unnamed protein product, partial [Durusdinium trenchii]
KRAAATHLCSCTPSFGSQPQLLVGEGEGTSDQRRTFVRHCFGRPASREDQERTNPERGDFVVGRLGSFGQRRRGCRHEPAVESSRQQAKKGYQFRVKEKRQRVQDGEVPAPRRAKEPEKRFSRWVRQAGGANRCCRGPGASRDQPQHAPELRSSQVLEGQEVEEEDVKHRAVQRKRYKLVGLRRPEAERSQVRRGARPVRKDCLLRESHDRARKEEPSRWRARGRQPREERPRKRQESQQDRGARRDQQR